MILLKKMYFIVVFFFLSISGIFAQLPQQPAQPTEVSDAELVQFASVFIKIQSIDQQVQQKMLAAVQNEGIEVQEFNEILNAEQNANQEVDATEEELEKFAAAHKAVEQIQNQAQQDMQKVITDNKLTVPRYQEIMMAVQSDPELQQKLQKLM
ncbi:MAG: DUF4168 domain-containing protein, partial [Bacteroidales bacterium]|nr:DUF4168 domain-containing protein [Bacteroidales bacterium]